ncbi:AUGMIN subunit 4 [Asimina triloba]
MAKGIHGPTLPPDLSYLIEQLERHCLAPDGSSVSKSAYYDLQQAREEVSRERLRYLEAMAIYCEAIAMVEEYQQAANLGGSLQGLYPHFGLKSSPQVYESLECRLVVAEAAQRLRLPLLSKDGEIHEEEIEKWSMMSRSSLDSTSTSATIISSSSSTHCSNSLANNSAVFSNGLLPPASDSAEPGVGGVPNRFLGITPGFLWQVQLQQIPFVVDTAEYQKSLAREMESRLKAKCDKLADAFEIDDIDSSSISQFPNRLPERLKLINEEIEREEAALREDLYSADRKFAEYYNVLEQILAILVKLVKDLKLHHQHQYDELRKTWLCKRCETMSAKLRKFLVEATEEASLAYNKAVTRLREYQGVDPHFDSIARQYHDIVKKLEGMRWTIHQVEMDLKRSLDPAA